MTNRELLRKGVSGLRKAGIDEAEEKARILFLYIKKWSKTDFLLRGGEEADRETEVVFASFLKKAEDHIPVQHLTGRAPFYGRDFLVSPEVLIPRFDTEVLVHEVLSAVRKTGKPLKLLDLCTGSGCIAATLKLEVPGLSVWASDISEAALRIAERNFRELQAEVGVVCSDLFTEITEDFDVIVSNPPYIREEEIDGLEPEVRDHDPRLALSGGEDGLDLYRRIASEAPAHLREKGRLYLEIGEDQGEAVPELLKEAGFQNVRMITDLSGLPRVVLGERAENV